MQTLRLTIIAMQVHLILPAADDFSSALEALYGRAADDELRAALPYSAIVRNEAARAIALLGVRFDMTGMKGNQYSVVHYADTLRHPERAALRSGALRFVCAEPGYTELVLKREGEVSRQARMNLDNLRRARRIRVSVDCVAFDDGSFDGPDSRSAFQRLERERAAEHQLVDEIISAGPGVESILVHAMEAAETKSVAHRFLELLEATDESAMVSAAKAHRARIKLFRRA